MNDLPPMAQTEGWDTAREILVILAHPDDPEFFLGGSIARWIANGHSVRYVLLTKGNKGASDETLTEKAIAEVRMAEQQAAAQFLGVTSIDFLDYPDGYLIPDLEMRRDIVCWIRKYQPDILVTCDPTNIFPSSQYINHPDHRNAGQVVIDAVFPAAGNRFFFPDLLDEGRQPHEVEEVWMSLTVQPNIKLDVTNYWETRLTALKYHASQIGDPQQFEEKMLNRLQIEPGAAFVYQEQFRRIKFRKAGE